MQIPGCKLLTGASWKESGNNLGAEVAGKERQTSELQVQGAELC